MNVVDVATYVLSYNAAKSTAVVATLGVSPEIGNLSVPTAGNIITNFRGSRNCACVDLRLLSALRSVNRSLGASGGNLARLLFSI